MAKEDRALSGFKANMPAVGPIGPAENAKGGPISAIKEHFGLADGEVYEYAVKKILNRYGHNGSYLLADAAKRPKRHTNGNGAAAVPVANSKDEAEIDFILNNSISIFAAQPELYLRKRAEFFPPAALGTDLDLLFHPDCVRRRADNKGYATLISRLRNPDGRRSGGIHETFLLPDGSHHFGGDKDKMMKGKGLCKGTVVMLAPIDPSNGALGVGTGIGPEDGAAENSHLQIRKPGRAGVRNNRALYIAAVLTCWCIPCRRPPAADDAARLFRGMVPVGPRHAALARGA